MTLRSRLILPGLVLIALAALALIALLTFVLGALR